MNPYNIISNSYFHISYPSISPKFFHLRFLWRGIIRQVTVSLRFSRTMLVDDHPKYENLNIRMVKQEVNSINYFSEVKKVKGTFNEFELNNERYSYL